MMGQRFDLHGQEAYAIGREEGRREALMEAAKAVCKDCKHSDLPEKLKKKEGKIHGTHYKKGDFVHRSKAFGNFIMCEANEIHKLIADQGQQPDGEGEA